MFLKFTVVTLFLGGLLAQSHAAEELRVQGKSLQMLTKTRYKPSAEQLTLLKQRRDFTKKHHSSEIVYKFYDSDSDSIFDSDSILAGSLSYLEATKPEAFFFKSQAAGIEMDKTILEFLRLHKSLFQIDDETISSLKYLAEPYSESEAMFLQVYKGILVYNSTLKAELNEGISKIRSSLVPSSKVRPANLTPKISAQQAVMLDMKAWLAEGVNPTVSQLPRTLDQNPQSYRFQVTRAKINKKGQKEVEKKDVDVHLVIVPKFIPAKLAWCFSGSGLVLDAANGEPILKVETKPHHRVADFVNPHPGRFCNPLSKF